MGTFLCFYRLLLNLSQSLHDLVFLALYPLLLLLGILAPFLLFLQLSPGVWCHASAMSGKRIMNEKGIHIKTGTRTLATFLHTQQGQERLTSSGQ